MNKNLSKEKAYPLTHIKIENTWYWKCDICGKLLAPHKKEGVKKMWRNLQSKGAASKHLMTHDYNLVKHGRNVNEITIRQNRRRD